MSESALILSNAKFVSFVALRLFFSLRSTTGRRVKTWSAKAQSRRRPSGWRTLASRSHSRRKYRTTEKRTAQARPVLLLSFPWSVVVVMSLIDPSYIDNLSYIQSQRLGSTMIAPNRIQCSQDAIYRSLLTIKTNSLFI